MSDELLVFTHNDLDAIGCMLNLEFKFPNVKKKYFHTNYANIVDLTDQILEHQKQNGNTHLVMPDVSFSDNKESLRRLYNAFPHITHIDHHLYPEGFWDEFPNMKVVWDKSKCATKLCNEYFGNKGQNSNLDKLSTIIDVYDLWQVKHPAFDFAQDLNEYFWKYDIATLCKDIVEADYNLPSNFASVVNSIHEACEEAIRGYKQRKLIYKSGEITIAFVHEWFNQILIREMKEGQNFVIGANQYGIIKVRISENAPYTDAQKTKLREILTGNPDIGHMNAFTYKVKNVSFENIIQEIQHVVKAIEESCNVRI